MCIITFLGHSELSWFSILYYTIPYIEISVGRYRRNLQGKIQFFFLLYNAHYYYTRTCVVYCYIFTVTSVRCLIVESDKHNIFSYIKLLFKSVNSKNLPREGSMTFGVHPLCEKTVMLYNIMYVSRVHKYNIIVYIFSNEPPSWLTDDGQTKHARCTDRRR